VEVGLNLPRHRNASVAAANRIVTALMPMLSLSEFNFMCDSSQQSANIRLLKMYAALALRVGRHHIRHQLLVYFTIS